jgi:hypothetical protein
VIRAAPETQEPVRFRCVSKMQQPVHFRENRCVCAHLPTSAIGGSGRNAPRRGADSLASASAAVWAWCRARDVRSTPIFCRMGGPISPSSHRRSVLTGANRNIAFCIRATRTRAWGLSIPRNLVTALVG